MGMTDRAPQRVETMMSTQNTPTTILQVQVDRAIRQARADRAVVMRAAAAELSATIKRLFAGFHRPAPHKGATA